MSPLLRTCSVFAFVSLGFVASADEPKLVEILERSPLPANAIVYMHMPTLNKLVADAKMKVNVPESIEDIWMISDLDPATVRPRWEAGYCTLKTAIEVDKLAEEVGGYIDTVAGKEVVWSPRQMYLAPIDEHRMGFLRPANRAVLAKWIDPNVNVNYSGILVTQSKKPEQYLSLMVGVDLKDYYAPHAVEQHIQRFDSLQANPAKSVASILASINGISIIIGRQSLSECIFEAEFEKSPASLLPIANELLAEILRQNGSAAPEVLSWKVKADGNKLVFQGAISDVSLDAIVGIFSLDDQATHISNSMNRKMRLVKSGANQKAYVSKSYFDQIGAAVERTRRHKSQTAGSRAQWNDQQARRIDEMPTLNVDPLVIDYGRDVANLLRGSALAIRRENIRAGEIKAQQNANSGFYTGGYYSANRIAGQSSATTAAARGRGYTDYRQALTQIDKLTADLRRAMTEKYKIQF